MIIYLERFKVDLLKKNKELRARCEEYYSELKKYRSEGYKLNTAKRTVKIAKEALEIKQKVDENE